MPRSNKVLSGCLESTLASGFETRLLVQPTVSASARNSAITYVRNDIRTSSAIKLDFRKLTQVQGSHLLQGGLKRCLQQCLHISLWIPLAEHSVACHQNFCPGTHHLGDGIDGNTTIYFNPVVESLLIPQ